MNYYAYEYHQLKAMLMSGDAGSVKDMAARWKKMKTDLETRQTALYDLLGKLGDGWEGEAAEAFKDPMYNLATTAGLGASQAKSNWNALEDAADALSKAQADVPEATSMRASGNTEGLTLLQGNKMAYQQEYDAYQHDKQVIITRLNQVDTAYSGSADQIKDPPTYDGPPPKRDIGADERIGDGSGGGAGGGGYAGTTYSGTGGGGGYTGTGSGSGSSGGSGGSGAYGGSPALTGTSSYSGGDTNLSSGGVLGGPALPGGAGLPGGGTAGLPGGAAGGVGGVGGVIGGGLPGSRGGAGGGLPGGGLPGRGGAVPGGGALPGGRGAAGGGVLGGPGGAAGGRAGGVSGRLGPGGVLGGGAGGAGGPGASGGAAGARSGGMAGRGGAMMGGAGAQGQDRRRTTWLQETEDVWHGDQEAAPAVLGDPQDDEHTNR